MRGERSEASGDAPTGAPDHSMCGVHPGSAGRRLVRVRQHGSESRTHDDRESIHRHFYIAPRRPSCLQREVRRSSFPKRCTRRVIRGVAAFVVGRLFAVADFPSAGQHRFWGPERSPSRSRCCVLDGIAVVVDIRLTPISRKPGLSKTASAGLQMPVRPVSSMYTCASWVRLSRRGPLEAGT